MKVIYCDFCGQEISVNGSAMKGTKIILLTNEGYANSSNTHFDLCPHCKELIDAFILSKLSKKQADDIEEGMRHIR